MDSNINICTVSYFDVNQKNGGAIFAKNLNNYLNRSGKFISTVYCTIRPLHVENNVSSNQNLNNLKPSFLAVLKSKLRQSDQFELLVHFLRNDWNALYLVLKLFFNKRINTTTTIIFHDTLSAYYFSIFYSLKKFKILMIMHNDGSPVEMISSGIKNDSKRKLLDRFTKYQIKKIIPNIDKIVFLCDGAKDNFSNLYAVTEHQTISIPNGIKPIDYVKVVKSDSKIIRFVTVCTMNERKGIDTFIKCLPILNQNFAGMIEFTLLGQGPLLKDLQKLAQTHTNLNVVGESNKVSEYLQNADVFFLLSTNEGQPLSILEALRASLFVFATNVGCNASMVTPENGLLTNVDQESILNGFTEIINNWELLKSKSANSYQLFNSTFTEDKMFQSYNDVLNLMQKT